MESDIGSQLAAQPVAATETAPTEGPSAPLAGPAAPTAGSAAPTAGPAAPTARPAAPTARPAAPTARPTAPTAGPSAPTRGCCYCGPRCDCPKGFQKVLELKDVGLVIYRHTVRTEERNKISGLLETATKTTDNVFILQNTKSTELTSAQYLPGIEGTKISCPRCRKLAEHVHNLLQKAPSIERKHVTGICDRCCLMRGKPCDTCDRILNKFLSKTRRVSDGTKALIRQWLAKIEHILDDITAGAGAADDRYGDDRRYDLERIRATSELYIDQILIRSRKDSRQLDIKPLFRARGATLDEGRQFADDRSRYAIDGSDRTGTDFGDERYREAGGSRRDRDDARAGPEPWTRRSHSQESIQGRRGRDYGEVQEEGYKRRAEGRDFIEADDIASERYGDRGEVSEAYGKGDARYKESKPAQPTGVEPTRMGTRFDTSGGRDIARRDDDRSIDEFGKSKERSKQTKSDDRKYDEIEASRSKGKDVSRREEKEVVRGRGDGREGSPAEGKESRKVDTERSEREQKQRDKDETSRTKASKTEPIQRDKDQQKLKSEKELSTKDRGGQEQKQKGEKELSSTKDKGGLQQKQKGEKELSTKDKGGQEQNQKGGKDLSTKDKGGQEQKPKGEKELSTKDRGGQEQKLKGEKELSTKDKGGQEQKPKGEKEMSTKDKGGQEQKQKGEKELSTKDKGGQEQKQKGEKDLTTKDKGGQEQKQKGKGEKESDLKDKAAAETKKKGKGEKDWDTKDKDEKEPKEKEKVSKDDETKGKEEKMTMSMEKLYSMPKVRAERPKVTKEETKEEDKRSKSKKPAKKKIESKKGEDKKIIPIEEKEIAVNKICVRRASPDDHILKLVTLKKGEDNWQNRGGNLDETVNIEHIIRDHLAMKHVGKFAEQCPYCHDSDYGLDSLLRPEEPEFAEMIIGRKVYKYRPPLVEHSDEDEDQKPVVPVLFKAVYQVENIVQKSVQTPPTAAAPLPPEDSKNDSKPSKKTGKQAKPETEAISTKGIVRYALSDRSFIEKGWTMLPTEKVVRKMNVYRMRPAHPEFNWFEPNKLKRLMTYESGEPLAEFDEEGRGRWYYRNGRLALDYYDAEGLNAQQRFVVWSSGEPDERGRAQPYTVLATFDYLGNGIVLDHTGKIRLKYNQTEGVVLDRSIGPVSHWKWHALNDPPVLAPVMIDTQEAVQDPRLVALGAGGHCAAGDGADRAAAAERAVGPHNDEMLAIEFDNFVRAKSEKLTQTFKPFQIKMKALKINEYFSLRVLDQASVYLLYRDGRTNLKLNLGMVLDHHEIVDTDMADMGEVTSDLERFPARTESLAALQRGVQHAAAWERRRAAREARLRPRLPAASADRLAAAAARPRPYPAAPPPASAPCRCSRKPTGPNLYYDNRIF